MRLLERKEPAFTTLVSEDHDRRVIGFVTAGPLRHKDDCYQGEVSSLYVLRSHQRGNHGRRLFMAASNRLSLRGLKGLFIWVVAETERSFAGTPLKELGYGWSETPSYD